MASVQIQMTHQLLLSLLGEAKLSPEELGQMLGISGMTIRRWLDKPKSTPVDRIYVRAAVDVVYRLVVEGRLSSQSEIARHVLGNPETVPFEAILKGMGTEDLSDGFLPCLSRIGAHESRRREVDVSRTQLSEHEQRGSDWKDHITSLWSHVTSAAPAMEKFAAYGALFYLLTPFDLIPDTIPAFGFVDDFSVLGLAARYYRKPQSSPSEA